MSLIPAEEPGGMTWQEVKDFLDHIRTTCMDERQALKLEVRKLRLENDKLRAALVDAKENMDHWASYADDYFREKWDLAADLAAIDAVLGVSSGLPDDVSAVRESEPAPGG